MPPTYAPSHVCFSVSSPNGGGGPLLAGRRPSSAFPDPVRYTRGLSTLPSTTSSRRSVPSPSGPTADERSWIAARWCRHAAAANVGPDGVGGSGGRVAMATFGRGRARSRCHPSAAAMCCVWRLAGGRVPQLRRHGELHFRRSRVSMQVMLCGRARRQSDLPCVLRGRPVRPTGHPEDCQRGH